MNPEQIRSKCRLAVCALALFSAPAAAVVPSLDTRATPATTSCGKDPGTGRSLRLRHFADIIFLVTQPLFAANPLQTVAIGGPGRSSRPKQKLYELMGLPMGEEPSR